MTKKFEIDFLISYSREEIANELVRISKITGNRFVTRNDIEKHGRVHYDTIKRKFGGLIKALIFAKLITEAEKKKKYGRVDKEELFKEIGRIWELTLTKYNRRPIIRDFKEHSNLAPWVWESHFGSFRKALAEYLLWEKKTIANSQKTGIKFEKSKKITDVKDKLSFSKRTIPPGLRWQILSRDNYKCTICGKTPQIHHVILEVDHIVPWSKGGPTAKDNLRTLCSDCNKGKTNKL